MEVRKIEIEPRHHLSFGCEKERERREGGERERNIERDRAREERDERDKRQRRDFHNIGTKKKEKSKVGTTRLKENENLVLNIPLDKVVLELGPVTVKAKVSRESTTEILRLHR